MSHPNKGRCIGGIRTLEDLRGRCFVDPPEAGGCWHLRTAYGRPVPHRPGQHQALHVHDVGTMTAPRAALVLHRCEQTGVAFASALAELGKRVVYRCCGTHDCVNPEHLRRGTRAQSILTAQRDGRVDMQKVARVAAETGRARARLTPEMQLWIVQSTQSGREVARAVGVCEQRISRIRVQARRRAALAAPSVFALGDAANVRRRRAA